jgi:serine/threonine-protein kinase HipA
MNKCLFCYAQLAEPGDFHPACSRKIFGKAEPPELPYSENQMLELAGAVIRSQKAVPGVQPKLSLAFERASPKDIPRRFTIVGLWGDFILKPPTQLYPHLPELEDATMHLAELSGIQTVPHSLIKLQNGKPAYITRRIDRNKGLKTAMEDMCQLTEKLTEQKYNGSYEQIGKAIIKYSSNPMLDIVNFFEQVLFSFLTGNADMHLKNFSLIRHTQAGYVLSPAYDMVATALVVEGDSEEMALTLNGKKRNITPNDFKKAMNLFPINPKARDNMLKKFTESIPQWTDLIQTSFLPDSMKERLMLLIKKRAGRMELPI